MDRNSKINSDTPHGEDVDEDYLGDDEDFELVLKPKKVYHIIGVKSLVGKKCKNHNKIIVKHRVKDTETGYVIKFFCEECLNVK